MGGVTQGSHVKIRGFKVFLDLIEKTMLEHPNIKRYNGHALFVDCPGVVTNIA